MYKQKLHLFFFLILFLSVSLSALALLLPKSYAALFLPWENAQEAAAATVSDKQPFVVVIDAGHGGEDPGKIGTTGILEKDINLAIAMLLRELLESQDIQVFMTRDSDKDLSTDTTRFKISDMKHRIAFIQETHADLVISIHQNSYTDPKVYGAQCFYYTPSEEGKTLAALIQSQIISSTEQTKIREIKANDDYYLLKHSPVPTVIAECGFLSNPQEEQLLSDAAYERKMAWAIHLGILQYFRQQQ